MLTINGQKYSEIYKHFDEEDRFPYHLKQLLRKEHINKRDGKYFLTPRGLSEAELFNLSEPTKRRTPTPTLLFVFKYKSQYLIKKLFHTDQSRPTLLVLPGDKLNWGKSIEQTINDLIINKYSIEGDISFHHLQEYMESPNNKLLMFHNLFLVYKINVSKIIQSIEDQYQWMSIDKIKKHKNIHTGLEDFIISDKERLISFNHTKNNYCLHEHDLTT